MLFQQKSFNSSFLFPIWLSSYLLQMGKFKPITSSASITSELEKVQLEQLKRYKKIREVRLVRGSLLIVLISNNNAFVS